MYPCNVRLRVERNDASIAREAPLDGIYIIRTSERADAMSALGTRCKNSCRAGTGKHVLRFEQLTETSPFQQHVFSLLGLTP